MRIIAGKFRNRNLKASDHFRPTTDRVRETLFNMLQNDIGGSVFIDAFAGSGAVGIEAISRGASMVYFLENGRKAIQFLEANLRECCEEENWRLFKMETFKGLEVIHNINPAVHLIFYDPPYAFDDYEELLLRSESLFPDAIQVLETSARKKINAPDSLELFKEREIGETRLLFYRKL